MADPPPLRSFTGAIVRRIVDHSRSFVPEHAHDWPLLSLFVVGSYHNRTELGEEWLHRPSAILYRPGSRHENRAGEYGFEQIEIEFDPDWLGVALPDVPVSRWTSGRIASLSRRLALICNEPRDERTLRSAVISFLDEARLAPHAAVPAWLPDLERSLESSAHTSARFLAQQVGRHPFWVGQAYRNATGETLQQAISRMRVQRASKLLRETGDDAAAIAVEAGFCDQSHMIRTFRRLLGRKPSEVRADVFRNVTRQRVQA